MAKREKRASWFKLFLHQKPLMDAVPDATLGKAIKASMQYFDTGEISTLDPLETAVFMCIKQYVDEAFNDYQKDIENGKKGGRPRAKPTVTPANPDQPGRTQADAEADADADAEKDSVYSMADKPPAVTPFAPPNVEDIRVYCQKKGYRLDAQRFVDYYASTGWCVGKSPMRDWRAAVRNWSRKETPHETTGSEPSWTVGTTL